MIEYKKLLQATLYAFVVLSHDAAVYPPNILPNSDLITEIVGPILSHLA